MLNIIYFASIREQLGLDGESLAWDANLSTVSLLVERLSQREGSWSQLKGPSILVAVNQQMSNGQSVLKDGDEVAFFPPVTGG